MIFYYIQKFLEDIDNTLKKDKLEKVLILLYETGAFFAGWMLWLQN